ncbi:D-arabinono-1,4-lactone oxidase [Actinokineospora globicatena]|uniref:D-arabinono-1,4-lactone oxidase n=1 Tax=Actinokineospora globicatena TaxID=103729 RepID=UPI0020A2CFD8|nr:D-arabinono-1,4-lactone oxidase [Actinokineospora globicatena]MCP2301222.1 L-gulonolactone oxidase [Actinokineospora globicatena]GLW77142.1 L-gulonolactone oxidase [Actinokineospora globicatena]GLW83976.1 L-gulonolactone oxidase [Actinokineospora globicatena]
MAQDTPLAWRNWAGTESATAAEIHSPADVAGISAAITSAAERGSTVRARGSGHSFTAVGAAHGVAIDLSNWTGVVAVDGADVTVRSGTTLAALNTELDRRGRALANLGDIDAQTISGAISTGTHGTGARLGGIATQVSALELVLADGTAVRCSATERPDLFAAARIGLGALGVITMVTLRTEPAFVLAAAEQPEPLDQVLERLDENCADNDHFEFYWFPYGRKALTKRNNRLPVGARPRPLSPARRFFEYEIMENGAFGALCKIGRFAPQLVRPLNKLSASVLSPRSYSDVSHKVFVTSRRVRFVESEYAIPREALAEVLAELRARVPQLAEPVMFPVEVRVAARDDIWLSTAYDRDSAYIAIHQYRGMPYRAYFALFESIVDSVGGRPHWGKMHTLDAEKLRGRYPRFDDFARIRSEVDPGGLFRNPYTDRVLGPIS